MTFVFSTNKPDSNPKMGLPGLCPPATRRQLGSRQPTEAQRGLAPRSLGLNTFQNSRIERKMWGDHISWRKEIILCCPVHF